MLKKQRIGIFNFNHDYENQNFYKYYDTTIIYCNDLRGVNGYCEDATLKVLEKRSKPFPFLCYLGSGNMHYLSYLHQKSFKEDYTLVLFDHHSDMYEVMINDTVLSCGSWLRRVIDESIHLRQVIIIGVGEQNPIYKTDIPILVLEETACNQMKIKETLSKIKYPVFLSIDKDVLHPNECATNWNQGSLSLCDLLDGISFIMKHYHVLAVDVCGEKAKDTWDIKAEQKNAEVNQKIIQTLFQS